MPEIDRKTLEARAAVLAAPDETLLTVYEVALVVGVSPASVRRWNFCDWRGGLRPCTKRGGRNLYRAADLRRWLGLGKPNDGANGGSRARARRWRTT